MKKDTFSIKEFEKFLKDLKENRHCGLVELKINMFEGGITSVQLRNSFSYKKLKLTD